MKQPPASHTKLFYSMIEKYVQEFGAVAYKHDKWRYQMHHVVGRTYVHNKILIGPWFVNPVTFDLHDVSSNNPYNVTHYPKRFTDEFGLQSRLWMDMVKMIVVTDDRELPFHESVSRAIMDTGK